VNKRQPSDPELDGDTLDRSDQETRARGEGRAPHSAQPLLLEAGQAFGGYRLLRPLGKGGFGQVWEAESLETGRRLALKILTETAGLDESARQRFQREGRLAAAVTHPRCVYVFGAEEIEGYPVISMELVVGGTLHDEVKRRGALPFREAVDRVLDVLEGLEAAQTKGVIHRDVKPSNCFLDATGRAKIGDFGLSRTLEVDTKLTTTGVFMGTPAYSSPEQVRAEPLDFRADLYSAGATLYTLLAGDVPFPGSQLGPVLARILANPPAALDREKVPAGLERVVQRLMAKEREKRYASYAEARAALLAYSSQGLTAASLAKRFAAAAVDNVLMSPLTLGVMSLLQTTLITPLVDFLYYWLLEGRWGSSLGKRLFRLRVVTAAGGEAGWGAVGLRSAAYMAFAGLPVWPRLFLTGQADAHYAHSAWPPLAMVVAYAAMAATMRRRNAFAGVHELLSRTRVVALPERRSIAAPKAGAAREAQPGSGAQLGPFVVHSVLWERDGESVALASDPVLDRPVFVHHLGPRGRPRPIPVLAESGPGRLEWLQGRREEGQAWDAFEAPDGIRYLDWVRSRGRLSWSEVASVLATLLPELERRGQDGTSALSLDLVWVDSLGQGRLLDFPLRDPAGADAAETFAPGEWRGFLKQFVLVALEGRLIPQAELAGLSPRVPLAERARVVVAAVCGEPCAASPRELGEKLAASAEQPAEVNAARRGAALAIAGTWSAFALFIGLIMGFWGGPVLELVGLKQSLRKWRAPVQAGLPPQEARSRRDALERLAGHYYAVLKDRGSSGATNPIFGSMDAEGFLATLGADDLRLAEEIAARHARLPATEVAALREKARVKIMTATELGSILSAGFASLGALLGVALAGVARGGVSLRLGGISVQKVDGTDASRLRCLWRGLVAWLPLLLPLAAVFLWRRALVPATVLGWILIGAGTLYAVLRPTRGMQDWAAGTHLVPR
jgi:eukaryotic-like serine/threonine-protein kinase